MNGAHEACDVQTWMWGDYLVGAEMSRFIHGFQQTHFLAGIVLSPCAY